MEDEQGGDAGHTGRSEVGGFRAGEVLTGTGVAGVIARVEPDGSRVQPQWVTLPDEAGLLGGLHVGRRGVTRRGLLLFAAAGLCLASPTGLALWWYLSYRVQSHTYTRGAARLSALLYPEWLVISHLSLTDPLRYEVAVASLPALGSLSLASPLLLIGAKKGG